MSPHSRRCGLGLGLLGLASLAWLWWAPPSGTAVDGTPVRAVRYRIMGLVYENRGREPVRCWYTSPRWLGFTLPPRNYLAGLEAHGYSDFHCQATTAPGASLHYPIPVQFGRPY